MAEHGTWQRYKQDNCPCRGCRAAHVAAQLAANKRRAGLPDDQKPHGTYNCYINYECRCALCREANVAHVQRQRAAFAERLRRYAEQG